MESTEDERFGMPQTKHESVRYMTGDQKFELARTAYAELHGADPDLDANPGTMASRITEQTGLDFETAAIVALSAAIGR